MYLLGQESQGPLFWTLSSTQRKAGGHTMRHHCPHCLRTVPQPECPAGWETCSPRPGASPTVY